MHPESEREMVFTRVFAAPPARVFDAWTDPEQVVRWWGPRGFTTTTHSTDVRPGGVWRFTMHGPDGRDYPNEIIFLEVDRPRLLRYRHAGDETVEPVTFHTTVTFAEEGGQTRLTMRSVFVTREQRDMVIREYRADEGAVQTLDRLGEHLATG
jgi:uncharacterized protein YndB with AHSA1/START domain